MKGLMRGMESAHNPNLRIFLLNKMEEESLILIIHQILLPLLLIVKILTYQKDQK